MKTIEPEEKDKLYKIVDEQDTDTGKAIKAAKKFIKNKTAPKTTPIVESSTKAPESSAETWKPTDHYKPGILNIPKEVSL